MTAARKRVVPPPDRPVGQAAFPILVGLPHCLVVRNQRGGDAAACCIGTGSPMLRHEAR